MSLTNRVGLLAGLATLTIAGTGFAGSDESYNEALKQIDELRAELAEMKSQQGENWLTEQRSEEIRSLVQDVLADADTRASLQSSGMTAGWDKGFFLASPDGNFRLQVKGQIQFRYVLNIRSSPIDVTPDSPNTTTQGFEMRRVKLKFLGNIIDRSWTYKVQGNFSADLDDSGAFQLEDAYIQKDFDNGLYVRGGQYKVPFTREELVSSTKQLMVERSLLNSEFGAARGIGIEAGWQGDWLRGMIQYNNGSKNINQGWENNTNDFGFAGRGEFKIAGEWGQFDDLTSWNGDPFGALVGIAFLWEGDRGNATGAVANKRDFSLTADVTLDFGGANLFAWGVWRRVDNTGGVENQDQWGFMVQGGIFVVPDEFELFARYEYGDLDEGALGLDNTRLSVVSGGVNWYFGKNAAKFTTDIGYAFNSISGAWADSGAGYLEDGTDQDGQFVWRAQFQLLF